MKPYIYLDNAATTKPYDEVISGMSAAMGFCYGNPSSTHQLGGYAKKLIEEARRQVAALIHAEPEEILFTSGATEANNWILQNVVEDHSLKRVITSSIEHTSILKCCKNHLEKRGIEVRYIGVDENGIICINELEKQIAEDCSLVSIMLANNEVGSIQPVEAIAKMIKGRQIILHTDAVQAIGHIDINVTDLGIDFLSASAHKFHGPKGVGFLYAKKQNRLKSMFWGGGQENGKRAGTENIPGIVGMGIAAEITRKNIISFRQREFYLREVMINRLIECIPECRINGSRDKRLSNNIHFSVSGIPGEYFVTGLDMKGICVSTGSACTSGQSLASHVLLSMGRGMEEAYEGVRISLSHDTSEEEIETVVRCISSLYHSYNQ